MAETVPAGNGSVSTLIWLYPHARRVACAIPRDATALEATCFAALLAELAQMHILRGWDWDERVKHYNLQRFFFIPEKTA